MKLQRRRASAELEPARDLRVLLACSSSADAASIDRALSFASGRRWLTAVVESVSTALSALEREAFDAIVVDTNLPGGGAKALIRYVAERGEVAPVIVMADDPDGVAAGAALRMGAEEFVTRDELDGQRLLRVIAHARLRHDRRRELVLQNQMLEDLVRERTQEAIEIQDLERERLAEALHDESGQWMTALSAQLAALEMRCQQSDEQGEMLDHVATCRRLCEGALDEISRACRHLHPSVIERGGLVSALRGWQAQGASPRVSVRIDGVDETTLPKEVQLAVYRCAQESLTNARKHAAATSVEIVLEQRGDRLELAVLDDGVGVRPSKHASMPTGVGLVGMRQRVEHLSGDLDMGPNHPRGTAIRVSVPLQP